jgi:hypothetical protein
MASYQCLITPLILPERDVSDCLRRHPSSRFMVFAVLPDFHFYVTFEPVNFKTRDRYFDGNFMFMTVARF